MKKLKRERVTLSLAADVIERADAVAAEQGLARSVVMEEWLRYGEGHAQAEALEREIVAYYGGQSNAESDEALSMATAAAAAASTLAIDDDRLPEQPKSGRKAPRRRAAPVALL